MQILVPVLQSRTDVEWNLEIAPLQCQKTNLTIMLTFAYEFQGSVQKYLIGLRRARDRVVSWVIRVFNVWRRA